MLPTILSASFGDPSAFALGLIRYPAGQKLNINLNNEKIKLSTVIKLSVDTLTVRSFFRRDLGRIQKDLDAFREIPFQTIQFLVEEAKVNSG